MLVIWLTTAEPAKPVGAANHAKIVLTVNGPYHFTMRNKGPGSVSTRYERRYRITLKRTGRAVVRFASPRFTSISNLPAGRSIRIVFPTVGGEGVRTICEVLGDVDADVPVVNTCHAP